MDYGFIKVAAAIPAVRVADCKANASSLRTLIEAAANEHVDIVCFPELSLTGYTCGDLFLHTHLLRQAEDTLALLLADTAHLPVTFIIGMPLRLGTRLANVAVVVQRGLICGVVPKTFLPNYKEFYEQRWFTSALDIDDDTTVTLCGQRDIHVSRHLLFRLPAAPQDVEGLDATFGIELCEDVWAPIPPSSWLATAGAELIFNLSATNELISKHHYLLNLLSQQSARTIGGYVYASCGYGESTQDVVYGGNALIYENGTLLASSARFSLDTQLIVSEIDIERLQQERRANTTFHTCANGSPTVHTVTLSPRQHTEDTLTRLVNPHPFVPTGGALDERCDEIFNIQVAALARRIDHTNARTVVVGISGGLDSTLALLVCVRAMDKLNRPRTDIIGITMPGFGTTGRTHNNALALMTSLGITIREISIRAACELHFRDIGHDIDVHDVTYENVQARERTQVLMDVSNQESGFVVGTGDLSESALGWATYNADHMSHYGVNCSIPKTLVKHLVRWVAQTSVDDSSRATLLDIIDTPISPELLPADADGNIAQKTENLVGPYELHDFFLYHALRHGFSPRKIYALALRAFAGGQDYSHRPADAEPVGIYTPDAVRRWLETFFRRFFSQQFKRSCIPDGPKVGSVSLSPRGDLRMPSDASSAAWTAQCRDL